MSMKKRYVICPVCKKEIPVYNGKLSAHIDAQRQLCPGGRQPA